MLTAIIDISKLYDLLYDKADRLIKQYNPCNIHKENNRIVCNNEYMCKVYGQQLCCTNCKYLGEHGCTTKSLGCKLGCCWQGNSWQYAKENKDIPNLDDIFMKKMDKLRYIAYRYEINKPRYSKEETLCTNMI